jgi:hypothetical protein
MLCPLEALLALVAAAVLSLLFLFFFQDTKSHAEVWFYAEKYFSRISKTFMLLFFLFSL